VTSRGRRNLARSALGALAFALPLSPAHADSSTAWPDTPVARLEALALIQTLNAEILASRSATFTLEKWCAGHHLSGTAEPKIVARQVDAKARPATAEQRQRLDVGPTDEVKVRHVQLLCGERVFSEADNWYVTARLTAEMNRLLETTTTPFGKAVQDLHPYRRTFSATVLWQPLPEGWETRPLGTPPQDAAKSLSMPDALFEHRAVLYTEDGKPFSEVDEVYQRALLDFAPPAP
jgi:chorismate-pyruvate lyase